MKIFLDDTKLCPSGWSGVKTIKDFKSLLLNNRDNIEAISLDYELEFTDKGKTGIDACQILIDENIQCPDIIIHSIHPKAYEMLKMLSGHFKNIEMKEYDIQEVIKFMK